MACALERYGFDIQSLAALFGELKPLSPSELVQIHEAYCQVRERPMPEHLLNDTVRIADADHGSVDCAIIGLVWHNEQRRWHYHLQIQNGRRLGRRYVASELQAR